MFGTFPCTEKKTGAVYWKLTYNVTHNEMHTQYNESFRAVV